jgi:hypothetical protein
VDPLFIHIFLIGKLRHSPRHFLGLNHIFPSGWDFLCILLCFRRKNTSQLPVRKGAEVEAELGWVSMETTLRPSCRTSFGKANPQWENGLAGPTTNKSPRIPRVSTGDWQVRTV